MHQTAEMQRLVMEDVEGVGVWRQGAITQGFGVAEDDAQARAQFVGDVGGHLAALTAGKGEIVAHLIKGGC